MDIAGLAGSDSLHLSYEIDAATRSNSYETSPISEVLRKHETKASAQQTWRSVVKKLDEPPSCNAHLVIIGRNSRGDWVAQEQNGLFGGLFVNRAQAMKYALFENGDHPATIVLTSNIVELDMHRIAQSSPQTVEADESSRQARAA
jgi:hypothetical protein